MTSALLWEKFLEFLPSILTIAIIGIAGRIYLWLIEKYFGTKLNSVRWFKSHSGLLFGTIGFPGAVVFVPMIEELVFRMPLILLFENMSAPWARNGLLLSSALFGLVHWRGVKVDVNIELSNEELATISDDRKHENERLAKEKGRVVLIRKVRHVCITFGLGTLIGYYGITYQSIWLCIGIHAAWNLLMPWIIAFLYVLFTLILFGCSMLRERWIASRQSRFYR